MTTSAYFTSSKMLRRLHEGPLGVHIDLYSTRLLKEGHCRQSAWRCLRVVGDFSRWLADKQLGLRDVDEQVVAQYQAFRVRYRCPFASDWPALKRLLVVLREVGAIALQAPITLNRHEQIFEDFKRYLDRECGLTHVTIIHHLPVVRRFLHETCANGADDFAKLSQADITRYVERHAPKPPRDINMTTRIDLTQLSRTATRKDIPCFPRRRGHTRVAWLRRHAIGSDARASRPPMECKGENVMTHRAIGSLLCGGVLVLAATMFGVMPSGPAQATVAVAFALAAVRLMGAI